MRIAQNTANVLEMLAAIAEEVLTATSEFNKF